MGNSKWIHITFFLAGTLLFVVTRLATAWIWGYFAKPKALWVGAVALAIAGVTTFLTWRNQEMFTKVSEIVGELVKVTWPTRKETWAATIVVIITVIVFAGFLGFFDLIWSWATGIIYS